MLTSLNRDESWNFLSHSKIKFLEVKYWEVRPIVRFMLRTTQSVWLPDPGWPAGHSWKRPLQLPLKSRVICGLLPAPSFMMSQLAASVCIVGVIKHCWVVHMSTATPLTHFHCTAIAVYFSDTDWSEHGRWWHWLSHINRPSAAADPSYLLSAISLSRKQP